MDSGILKNDGASLRSLLEQLELDLKLGDREALESSVQRLLATVKWDEYRLTWAENGNYEFYNSVYLENIFEKLWKIPYDSKVVRLSRICGHCQKMESLAHSSGHVNGEYANVRHVLNVLETIEEL